MIQILSHAHQDLIPDRLEISPVAAAREQRNLPTVEPLYALGDLSTFLIWRLLRTTSSYQVVREVGGFTLLSGLAPCGIHRPRKNNKPCIYAKRSNVYSSAKQHALTLGYCQRIIPLEEEKEYSLLSNWLCTYGHFIAWALTSDYSSAVIILQYGVKWL